MISDIYKDAPDKAQEVVEKLGLCAVSEFETISKMGKAGINSVNSTSCGRLFDAVSSILGIRHTSSFEGEASTTLMFKAMEHLERSNNRGTEIEKPDEVPACDPCLNTVEATVPDTIEATVSDTIETPVDIMPNIHIPTHSIFRMLIEERLNGADICKLAFIFHKALAQLTVNACEEAGKSTGISVVALSGGCFQNRLLLELTEDGLTSKGFRVLRHKMIPANDGGIALGQALHALNTLNL